MAANLENGGACLVEYRLRENDAKIWPLKLCSDPHSIVVAGGAILVVSTANNMIVSCVFEEDDVIESIVHRFDDADTDVLHLNALCSHDQRLLVGMFGRRPDGEPWVNAIDGRVQSLDGSFISASMQHPHSICVHQNRLLGIESLCNTIFDLQGGAVLLQTDIALGYMRGLASNGRQLAFATSHRRDDRQDAAAFTISLVENDGDRYEILASAQGPRGYEETYDLLFLADVDLPVSRRLVRQRDPEQIVVLGPRFRWEKMRSLSFANGEWAERFAMFDLPRNILRMSLKLIVMSEFPLVQLKVAFSNDNELFRFNNSIERWIDIYEGLSVIDLDWQRFARLRGEFDPSCLQMALIGGFISGFDGAIRYQFVTVDGGAVQLA